jgi:hypothetical protein
MTPLLGFEETFLLVMDCVQEISFNLIKSIEKIKYRWEMKADFRRDFHKRHFAG